MFRHQFEKYAKEHYGDAFIESSAYLCEDQVTYKFKTIDDKQHTLIYDLRHGVVIEIL